MRCIFCKVNSSNSKTVEHIIPESLGNTEHILRPGIVCDKCNNYFAREVEKPLLDTQYFIQARFHNMIGNKRGKIPAIKGIHLNSNTIIEVSNSPEGKGIFASSDKDHERFIKNIMDSGQGKLIVPIPNEPANLLVARFIGKVAIEVLAQRIQAVDGGIDEIVDKKELDDLRNFVRIGGKNRDWPVHKRRIYDEGFTFYEQGYETYEILHEYDLLYTEAQELFCVVAILGMEYTINMGGPEIDGYIDWLKEHNNVSPLYRK